MTVAELDYWTVINRLAKEAGWCVSQEADGTVRYTVQLRER